MSSSVTRIESAADRRAESRRKETLRQMIAAHHALGMEIQAISLLGDAERATRLEAYRTKLALLDLKAGTLQRESQELADAAKGEDDNEATG